MTPQPADVVTPWTRCSMRAPGAATPGIAHPVAGGAALFREKQITWAHWDIVTDADYYPLPVDGEPDKPDAQREDAHV